jgi:hypothetical protein
MSISLDFHQVEETYESILAPPINDRLEDFQGLHSE